MISAPLDANVSTEEQPPTTPKLETTTEGEASKDQAVVGFDVDIDASK